MSSESKKYIRFIDSGYNTLFYVPDGGSVRVTSGYDGLVRDFPCKYIDDYHFEVCNTVYHIGQYAELMELNNSKYEPAREIGDLEFYNQKYYDREHVDEQGKAVPYYDLITLELNRATSTQKDVHYAFCPNPSSLDKTFCRFVFYPHTNFEGVGFQKDFAARIEDLCDDYQLCSRINNIVWSIKQEHQQTVEDILHSAEVRSEQTLVGRNGVAKDDVSLTI